MADLSCHKIDEDAVISEMSFTRLRKKIGVQAGYYVNQAAHGNRYHDKILMKAAADIQYYEGRIRITFKGKGHSWRDNVLILPQEYPAIIESMKGKMLSEIVHGDMIEDRKITSAKIVDGKTHIKIEDRDLFIRDIPEGDDWSRAAMLNGIISMFSIFNLQRRDAMQRPATGTKN